LILRYQGLEEENFDQKSPGPPGWGLMQRASSSLITETNAKKNQAPNKINYVVDTRGKEKKRTSKNNVD
jgi:hypothetical protein